VIFDDSSILITGGTGSLGKSLVSKLLANSNARRVIIFSRDELKQSNMRNEVGEDSRLRWFIGDIRDLERLKRALHGVDFVIHAAALKQVDTGEYNPMEFIKTNVIGSSNVIEACIDSGVKKVVALSTDKASSPINLYGATKLTADKLFIAANSYGSSYSSSFSVVRYGNVIGSRGSVVPYFRELSSKGLPIPVTDKRMTRFWITLEQATQFVLDSFHQMSGGELYVPRIPSIRIVDLAKVIAPNSPIEEIGMRPGEKLHEEMISFDDSRRTTFVGDRYVVSPVVPSSGYSFPQGEMVPEGFIYQSNTNDYWVSGDELSKLLSEI
jgi:UDP-N-acetylglucosamine 4,6-dehydratase/5-epimerase